MMAGLRVLFVFLGVAWFLAGFGATWSSCASSSQKDEMRATDLAQIDKGTADEIEKLTKEQDAVRKKADEKVAKAQTKLNEDQEKLDQAGTDLKKRITNIEGELAKARDAEDAKKVAKLDQSLLSLNKQLGRLTAGPKKRRDASAQAQEKAAEKRDAAVAKVQKKIEAANTGKAEQSKQARELAAKMREQSSVAKPIVATVLGLWFIVMGFGLGLIGGKRTKRVGQRRLDPDAGIPTSEFSEDELHAPNTDDVPAPEQMAAAATRRMDLEPEEMEELRQEHAKANAEDDDESA